MKRQRQRVTEKDSVERANESEKVGAGRRRGALLELYACLSRAVTWVKCPEDVGTRAQPERWHQVQSISWVEECRWSKVTRGAVLNGRKCIHLHNLLIVELIYSWNMLKIQQDYSFPNVGICYFSWFFFLPVFFTTAAAWLFWCHAAGESVLLPLWSWLEYLNKHWMDCQFWTGTHGAHVSSRDIVSGTTVRLNFEVWSETCQNALDALQFWHRHLYLVHRCLQDELE